MQQDSHKIDDLLRHRLAELPQSAPSAAGWERMEKDLDQDPDFTLRAALIGLAANQHASGWETLERKLNPVAEMDKQLASKLNSLTPAVSAGSWVTLSDKIDDAFGAEVDEVVNHKLQQDTTGTTSGWAALAARLELISYRRNLIGAWKVTEVSLLLSLFLLFIRFGPVAITAPPVLATTGAGFPMSVASAELEEVSLLYEGDLAQIDLPAPTALQTATAVTNSPQENPPNEPLTEEVISPTSPTETVITPEVEPIVIAESAPALSLLNTEELLSGPDYDVNWASTLPSPTLRLPEIDNSIPVRYHLNLFLAPGEINQVITPEGGVSGIEITGRNLYTNSSSFGAFLRNKAIRGN